ncbi:MAG: TIGR00341 family protein [Desulfobulbaceae bacterium]|nr:MAG: TIGR00341 family protein [Desulfobulbaceae bacterium]
MAQRVLKIILPQNEKKLALEMLNSLENTIFWQEESSEQNFVVSLLTETENSEKIMDLFEGNYNSTVGFKLIVFPVEASIPRTDTKETEHSSPDNKKTKKNPLRISREELYADIVGSTDLSATFILLTILSTLVVSVGLLQNNVAVIIGAMVIAPFLGPNVALALSACLADIELAKNAGKTMTIGITITFLMSAVMGYLFKITPDIPEILTRTQAGVLDIILALASGSAGVLAFTTGMSSAVIGVMVAVALLPPLTTHGLLLGAGYPIEALGALSLFLTNIICINLAGVTTFYFQGVTPRVWWEAGKARTAAKITVFVWSLLLGVLFFLLFILKV